MVTLYAVKGYSYPFECKVGLKFFRKNGAQGRDRTTDTRIFSPLLYQLSYLGDATRVPRQALGLYVINAALSRCAGALENGQVGGL